MFRFLRRRLEQRKLTDKEILKQLRCQKILPRELEAKLHPDYTRAVHLRRTYIESLLPKPARPKNTSQKRSPIPNSKKATPSTLSTPSTTPDTPPDTPLAPLPYHPYPWSSVSGRNCENVIGFVPLPVGLAGPLTLDAHYTPHLPLATTEGALVASTSRGARALSAHPPGVTTRLTHPGMTRAPVLALPSLDRAAALQQWCQHHFAEIAAAFDAPSRFARLRALHVTVAGNKAFLRFAATTGDAMGMNMVTQGAAAAVGFITRAAFPEAVLVSLSGNACADKKPAAVNWVRGRGRGVCAEGVLSGQTLGRVLKTTAGALMEVHHCKVMLGSAVAGSVGGFNAHAANVVAAMFVACGQDVAQVVESAQCVTDMQVEGGDGIRVSVTMPCVEVGTVGGGTELPAQKAMLRLLGCAGACEERPGAHADKLARVVCGAVLCGEVSLLAAQATGDLLSAHMRLNRGQGGGSCAPEGAKKGRKAGRRASP